MNREMYKVISKIKITTILLQLLQYEKFISQIPYQVLVWAGVSLGLQVQVCKSRYSLMSVSINNFFIANTNKNGSCTAGCGTEKQMQLK